MASAKPTQPPSGADYSALVKKVNELATRAGISKLSDLITGRIPAHKRWVGGEAEFDGTGLRDVVQSNAIMLDNVKKDVDVSAQAIIELRADVQALQEAPAAHPFP